MKRSKYASSQVQLGSIHDIYQRLQEEGYLISETALRNWVKVGCIHAFYHGKKALILYDDVLAYIKAESEIYGSRFTRAGVIFIKITIQGGFCQWPIYRNAGIKTAN